MSENRDRLWWVLRIGAAACFVGHGAFGIITKASWLPFFGLVGIGPDVAYKLMPIIGTIDIIAGLSVLVRPMPIVFLYMSVWALWTAALRPLSGGDVAEMLERAGNYGVPLAAVFLVSLPTTLRGWFAVARPHDLDPGATAVSAARPAMPFGRAINSRVPGRRARSAWRFQHRQGSGK